MVSISRVWITSGPLDGSHFGRPASRPAGSCAGRDLPLVLPPLFELRTPAAQASVGRTECASGGRGGWIVPVVPRLDAEQLAVPAPPRHQLLVRAPFSDPPVLQH